MPWDVRPAKLSDIDRIMFIDKTGLPKTPSTRWYKDRIKKYPGLFWVAYLTDAPMSDPNVLDPPETIVAFGNGVPFEMWAPAQQSATAPVWADLQDCGFLSRGVTLLPYRRQGMMRRIVENILLGFCEMGITNHVYSTFRKSNDLSTWFHVGRPGVSGGTGFKIDPVRSMPEAYHTGDLPEDRFMVVVKKPLPCNESEMFPDVF